MADQHRRERLGCRDHDHQGQSAFSTVTTSRPFVWFATHIAAAVTQAQRIAEFEELAARSGLGNRRVLEERLPRRLQPPAGRPPGRRPHHVRRRRPQGGQRQRGPRRRRLAAGRCRSCPRRCRRNGRELRRVPDRWRRVLHHPRRRRHVVGHPVTDLALAQFARSGHNRSLSCGVALASKDMLTPGDLLRAADEMQYEEKRRSRGTAATRGAPGRRRSTSDASRDRLTAASSVDRVERLADRGDRGGLFAVASLTTGTDSTSSTRRGTPPDRRRRSRRNRPAGGGAPRRARRVTPVLRRPAGGRSPRRPARVRTRSRPSRVDVPFTAGDRSGDALPAVGVNSEKSGDDPGSRAIDLAKGRIASPSTIAAASSVR